MSREIRKKIAREYFEKIESGEKTFEFRVADFECKPGDVLVLKEWEDGVGGRKPTGRSLRRRVGHVGRTKGYAWLERPDVAADAEKYGFQIISLLDERARFEVSCKAVILNGDWSKILLVEYEGGMFSLPGGHLEEGETPEEAVRREIREEVGIEYDGELRAGSFTFRADLNKIAVAYYGELDEGVELPDVQDVDEKVVGASWHAVDEVLTGETNKFLLKEYQDVVGDIIERRKK